MSVSSGVTSSGNTNTNYTSLTQTQNDLLTAKLFAFFKQNNFEPLKKMLAVINGESIISLRIIDWFSTNYAKKHYTVYSIPEDADTGKPARRFKVYNDYKLKLKAYSKKRFDPFCRWDRIAFPYVNATSIQTTVGQLNFFKWAIENRVIQYVETNYRDIENDMNMRNSISKRKTKTVPRLPGNGASNGECDDEYARCIDAGDDDDSASTASMFGAKSDCCSLSSECRKKREELSILASSCIKKEMVEVVVTFE
jgi:hypothetical protein